MKMAHMCEKGMKILFFTMMHLCFFITVSNAGEGWETGISVGVLNAKHRLVIGQKSDAKDGIDGRYDVPAMLSGEEVISSYLVLKDNRYWKDIRQTCLKGMIHCKKTWNIIVESEASKEIIELKWLGSKIPVEVNLIFIDMTTGKTIDMKSEQEYKYENAGKRNFIVEMVAW